LCSRAFGKAIEDNRGLTILNDPFELIRFNLGNQKERWALQAIRKQLGKNRGMNWRDPVR